MDEPTEEENSSASIETVSNAHVVILRTNISNEEIDKIFLDIAMALKSAGHVVSFLCCHENAKISEHMQDFDISRVFRWMPSSLFGFFKTPLRLLSSAMIIIWLKMFRNYICPSFVITDSFVVLPILQQIGVNVVHFYQFEEICRRNNIFRRLMAPLERWCLKHANKILIENRSSLDLIQQIYRVPFPTEVLYLTAAYSFLEQNIDKEQVIISRLPANVYYFLILGVFGPKLNCHTLIQAFELLLDRILSGPCDNRKNAYLVISGYIVDNKSLNFYNKLNIHIQHLKYESKIIVFKDMEMRLQKHLIANCTAVLMGDSGTTSCSPILECLSVGAIIISAKSDYAEELINDEVTGFVIDPTPEKYYEAMFKVLEDTILVGYIKYMISLDYFNRFSFSALEQQLQKIVENMADISNENRSYRYLSNEAYKRYIVETIQLLKGRQIFEKGGPLTGNQLKEVIFQLQMQNTRGNNLVNQNEEHVSEEEILIVDLDQEADVQFVDFGGEPQPGPSGLSSVSRNVGTARKGSPTSKQEYLARIDPRLNRREDVPQPGPSGLCSRSNILKTTGQSSIEESQSDSPSLSDILSLVQVEISESTENIPTPAIQTSMLQIEQQLSGLYDQFISPNEIQPPEIPKVAIVTPISPSSSDNPVPISIIDKGKHKMGTKIGEGKKKTSKPQPKTTEDNKDSSSSMIKPSAIRKSFIPIEKKSKPQTEPESAVNKKRPTILNKDKPKLTQVKSSPEKKPVTFRKADVNTSPAIPKTSGDPINPRNVKTPQAVTRGTTVNPGLSKDKNKPSEQTASSKVHGNRFQAASSIKKKIEISPSAPVGGMIVTTSGGKVKSTSTPVEKPVIKGRVQTPTSSYKRKPINPPGKVTEENIKPRTASAKAARTQKPTNTGNVIPPTAQIEDKTLETTPVLEIIYPEAPEIPVPEGITAQPNDETTQENISLTTSLKTITSISTVPGAKRTVKRRQKRTETGTKRPKLESNSLPNLSNSILESDFPISLRRSEPIDIEDLALILPPIPEPVKVKKVIRKCVRYSRRVKLVPVANAKLDNSTIRSSTLNQIVCPRSRRAANTYFPLRSRSFSSKGKSPRLLVKGRSILTVPKLSKSRSPRSGIFKLEKSLSDHAPRDIKRPLRKTLAATDLRICRLRRSCRYCTFRYVPIQHLPTGELPIMTIFPPSGLESESSIEDMDPKEMPIDEDFSTTENTPRDENLLANYLDEDAY